ncbi:TetR/AcrR family transcriptional regulator [Methylobacterium radiodurans]|uniref:TetR/AcrR family transcriptional regulator n=1 Tax=Methylobacterium radiodurans TaxID=2202828 RepID=A0A2U8VU73_9HYPH|nr:TetR/AcrR family transcriptional regulator [Methylobacterium radiodurans]AWN37235.1 TetR/AcrR family transcriptional regulator [Methylobacterium radiodurans]
MDPSADRRGERRAALREALIGAAERTVAEQGLAALRARDLARAAGCAVGAIYTVFPDLDALALAVNLRTLNLFDAALGPVDAPAPDRPAGGGTVGATADPRAAADALVRLGLAYLAFAQAHPLRWDALFRHRPPPGQRAPDWYVAEQARLFSRIERPLAALRPDLPEPERSLLARSLFSATHGIVALGLDEQRMALPAATLRVQLETLVRAMAAGLMSQRPGEFTFGA